MCKTPSSEENLDSAFSLNVPTISRDPTIMLGGKPPPGTTPVKWDRWHGGGLPLAEADSVWPAAYPPLSSKDSKTEGGMRASTGGEEAALGACFWGLASGWRISGNC